MTDRRDWDDWDEPSLRLEAVERRSEPRGVMRGLAVQVVGGPTLAAVEASIKGFFAQVGNPESFRLGDMHDVEVRQGALGFGCRVEVVRKEIAPRCGVALRIVRIAPDAHELLLGLVADK
jgi:hypothetical protein